MTNFVQLYKSTDVNAPALSGAAGALITVLNKCLVDGYTTASVTTLTSAAGTATATIPANATLVTGNYVTISGANEVDYNGTFQITVTNSTTFTYTVLNSPTSPATGTILYAKAGLQWAKPYTGTNAAVYRSADVTSNRFYFQVIDNAATAGGAKEAQLMGFEEMTAYNTGTRQFPNTTQAASGLSARKSTTADGTSRAWTLIGDDRTFYVIMNTGDTTAFHSFAFGHFIPTRTGEDFNTFVNGETSFNLGTSVNAIFANYTSYVTTNTSFWLARPWSGAASVPSCALLNLTPFYPASNLVCFGVFGVMALPNGPDTGYYVCPANIIDVTAGGLRGRLPGMYLPLQANPIANYETMINVAGLTGKTLTGLSACQPSSSASVGLILFDTFGPWT